MEGLEDEEAIDLSETLSSKWTRFDKAAQKLLDQMWSHIRGYGARKLKGELTKTRTKHRLEQHAWQKLGDGGFTKGATAARQFKELSGRRAESHQAAVFEDVRLAGGGHYGGIYC